MGLFLLIKQLFGIKLTLQVESHSERCIGEFIPRGEHMDFTWQLNTEITNYDFEVRFLNGTEVIKDIKNEPLYSELFVLEQTQVLRVCVKNNMNSTLNFPMQLKSGSDINDFSGVVTEVSSPLPS